MRSLILSMVLILASGSIFSQSNESLSKKEMRKLLREDRKEEAARIKEEQAIHAKQMMQNNAFVLEADMLFNRYGQSMQVQHNLNFILVDSTYGVIQVGSPQYIGQNGVGGVTIEGHVSNYEKNKNEKKGSYQINYVLQSPVGTYYVNMNVLSTGWAEADVRGNFSGNIRYSGKLVHPSKSRVYQGTSY